MGPGGYGSSVEGLHAVESAAAAGRVRRLWLQESREGTEALVELVGRDRVRFVPDVRPHASTDAPQGVVAECDPIKPVALDDLAAKDAGVIVLDHVQDPHNVGAIARSCLAAGITGMVVSGRRSAPLSAVAFKAAAGALESLPIAVVSSIPEALARLKQRGLWIVGLEAAAENSLFGFELFTEPVAVVVGAEGEGLSDLSTRRCDVLVSIPMAEGSESLNASVSAALACFEIMRVRTGVAGSQA